MLGQLRSHVPHPHSEASRMPTRHATVVVARHHVFLQRWRQQTVLKPFEIHSSYDFLNRFFADRINSLGAVQFLVLSNEQFVSGQPYTNSWIKQHCDYLTSYERFVTNFNSPTEVRGKAAAPTK